MAPNESFLERLARVRQGDEQAATELFRRYEAEIRRAVRLRLLDARLRRALDSSDVCQEVLKSFFLAAEADRYQIDSEEQLLKLLTEMARKKLIDFVRRQRARRRGGDRKLIEVDRDLQVAAPTGTPSQDAVRKELVARINDLLNEEERRIFELWLDEGLAWSDIAAQLGGTAEGVRQKYNRSRQRVRERLAREELAVEVRRLLSEDERRIVELRDKEGLAWPDVAARLGGTAEGLRRQYDLARQRARERLGEEEADNGWFLLG